MLININKKTKFNKIVNEFKEKRRYIIVLTNKLKLIISYVLKNLYASSK